ncbi:MAG TPA: radical SAM protein, partial [Verrucomicrobiae bacterium]|nr:radical SAM protein [Verrucomicrobiae bacterium]
MNFFVQRSELRDIYDKVAASERISEADALRLFESKDLNAVGAIADLARQKKVGNRASYIINRYVNYSNYCILSCQFCSFARKKRDADGFQFTVEEIIQKAREALAIGITELHIVGGLHPSLPFSYYTDMLKALKALSGGAAVPAAGSGGVSPPDNGKAHTSGTRTVPELAGADACATPRLHLKCFTAIEILHLAWLAK